MNSEATFTKHPPFPLWPGDVPGALGDGPQDRPTLTLLTPANHGPWPCIVICPGGGYSHRADHEGLPVAQWLTGLGIAAAVVAYRVSPYHHPVPLADAQRAIRVLRHRSRQWDLDSRRIGILGFSAGGHLAATAATIHEPVFADPTDAVDVLSSRPDALIACYPVISFGQFRHDGSMRNLLGSAPDEPLAARLSLERSVTPANPPTFLWHTADDTGVPVQNSLMLADAASRCGVPVELHVFPNGRHGLGLAEEDASVGQWTGLCAVWLKKIGMR